MIPEQILSSIEELKLHYRVDEIHEGNPIIIVIKNFPLPTGFKIEKTDLLLKIPISFPNGKPDMFWVNPDAIPKAKKLPFTPQIEANLGRQWLRYSWHLQKWNPNHDNLFTFIEFIESGLKKVNGT